jgi:peptidoglycan/xylan/chitin deacetylase (PgdA/CDA1 family)
LRYSYSDRHGLSLLATIAVVLLSFGGQRSEAAPFDPSFALDPASALARPAAESAGLSAVPEPTAAAQLPAAAETGKAEQSEFDETRAELLALRSELSSRGGRPIEMPSPTPTPTSLPTSTPTAVPTMVPTVVPANTPTRVPVKPVGAVLVPILMYHRIDIAGPKADAIRKDLSVSPANFAAQMSYLVRNGYHGVSVPDLVEYLASGKPLPPKPVVLTFDDGYLDNYANAFPALRDSGFTGTFFIITDFVGQTEYMTWEQAIEMTSSGMDLESHSLDHPDLSVLSASSLSRQMADSRAVLEKRLGKPVRYISYPAGRYSAAVVRAAQQAGYLGAVTTVYGESHTWGGQFELTRIRVRGTDSLAAFAQKVHGPDPSQTPSASSARLSEVK